MPKFVLFVAALLTATDKGAPDDTSLKMPKLDPGVEAAALRARCDKGSGRACLELYLKQTRELDPRGTIKYGVQLLEKACALDDAVGCGLLAEKLMNGPAPWPDDQDEPYLPTEAQAAISLAAIEKEHELAPKARLRQRVGRWLEHLCLEGTEGKKVYGCDRAANVFKLMLEKNPKAGERIAMTLEEARSDDSQFLLAELNALGLGIPKSASKGQLLHLSNCESNEFLPSCFRGAELIEKDDPTEAARLYKRACDGGVGQACARLAGMVRAGRGGEGKDAQALELEHRACLSDIGGCAQFVRALCPTPAAAACEPWNGQAMDDQEYLQVACGTINRYCLATGRTKSWAPTDGSVPDFVGKAQPMTPWLKRHYEPMCTKELEAACRKVMRTEKK